MPDTEDAVLRWSYWLRHWSHAQPPHVRAAVELLIWHGYWLRREDFTAACIRHRADIAAVRWAEARSFCDAASASSSEMAILDLAIALGEDRFRLGIMGHAHLRAIGNAVYAACGLAEVVTGA